jgi:hypothetical protein
MFPSDHRFETAVFCPTDLLERVRNRAQALVMVRVDERPIADPDHLRQPTSLLDAKLVGGLGVGHVAAVVCEHAGVVAQVLDEGSTQEDVEQLHPVADRQNRHVPFERLREQRHLETIPPVTHVRGAGMARLSVPLRVDVASAGDNQADRAVERRVVVGIELGDDIEPVRDRLIRDAFEGREHLRVASGDLDGMGVGSRDPAAVLAELPDDRDVSAWQRSCGHR